MKKFLLTLLVALGALSAAAQAEKPFTIPEVNGWMPAEGTFATTGRVVYPKKDAAALHVAAALVKDAKALMGIDLVPVTGRTRPGDIVLRSGEVQTLGQEGYQIRIGEQAELVAPTETGLYWATRTLLQMMEQTSGHLLPRGTVTDRPQYAHRGFSIDVARKFIPMSYLRSLVKIMGYHKMNVLQVHLNDNGYKQYFGNDWQRTPSAFRLECDTYPGLTARDGSYTKQEFRDLQALARENGVEIIPEIDVPAHSLAFTHYRPSLGSERYGADHLDLGNPEVYTFLDSLFAEYIGGTNPVFQGPRVCIGTDEYSNAEQKVVEQFRAFTDHYIRYVESFGKTAVVWGALTHAKGTTPVKADGVLMNCWYNGYAQPQDMKEQGYKLVSIPDGAVYIVPAAGYYYDYLNTEWLYDHWTPANIGGVQFAEGDSAVVGGMFAVWNDHAGNGISTKDIHHRVMPALQVLAAKCWSGKGVTIPYNVWETDRHILSEAPGVNELGRPVALQLDRRNPHDTLLALPAVKPGDTLALGEIGWDYSVSFTVDARPEARGTVLFENPSAKFFLADPVEGKVGFARDGYLNTFNYRLPAGQRVRLTVQGTNKLVRLMVDDRVVDELKPITLTTANDDKLFTLPQDPAIATADGAVQAWPTTVYREGSKMYYQRTLVFPLRHAGRFASTVTGLQVLNYIP
ncbi:MAG: family 20 glycosylhydrolase [Bacteroidaceae bacterium]|nr:family 20 glycosylhydrolase [Bacteroidaceae bacterium]